MLAQETGKMTEPDEWAKYEALGEDEVRKRIAEKKFAGRNLALAQEWLRRQERARSEFDRTKDFEVARRASEAAERAASAAERAAVAAERDADAAERAAEAAEVSNQNAATAKTIAMAAMIIAAIMVLVTAFSG